jgi:uncharacterized protein (UPF0261 family)
VEKTVARGGQREVTRVPAGINDPPFVAALLDAFRSIAPAARRSGLV